MDWKRQLTIELQTLMGTVFKVGRQSYEQHLNACNIDLSMLQTGVLRILHHEGDITISDLSRIMMIDPSTLVPSIDSLERKGYIQRERDPNDRRRVPLSLTDEGRAMLESLWNMPDNHPMLSALEVMGEAEANKLLELMKQLVISLPDGETLLQHAQSRIDPMLNKGKK